MTTINRNARDRLFKALFGSSERKDLTLELYNAINHTSYANPDDIQINTLEDVLYMGMKNDVSFLLMNSMNLYEQQSTENPNMPIRFLLYLAHLYEKYLDQNDLNGQLYGTKKMILPAPHLVILYNGRAKETDRVLRMSDLFEQGASSDLELQVHLLNINYGKDVPVLEQCKSLRDYAFAIDRYQKGIVNGDREQALAEAIREMEDGPVKRYLQSHQKEVTGMLLEEYDEEKVKQYLRREAMEIGHEEGLKQGLEQGLEQGLSQGREQGRTQAFVELVQAGKLSLSDAASCAHMSEADFRKLLG